MVAGLLIALCLLGCEKAQDFLKQTNAAVDRFYGEAGI